METPWKHIQIQIVVVRCHAGEKCNDLCATCQCHRKGWLKCRIFFCCNDRQKWWTFDSTSLINRNLHQLLWQTPPICIICAVFYLSNLGAGFWSINKKVKEMKFVSKPRKKYWNKWDRSSPSSLFGLHPVLDFCFGSSAICPLFFLTWKITSTFCFHHKKQRQTKEHLGMDVSK